MKLAVCTLLLTMLATGRCRSAPDPAPIVSQLHVLSIHVKDHASFDAVFLLCRDVLELPWVYGELSRPSDAPKRLYAGFSVGNAYLEPCGPYPDDVPFTPEQPARFHGLTFSPATTLVEAEATLQERGIPHSGILAGKQFPHFIYVRDPLLTSRRLALSLWEIQDNTEPTNLPILRSRLDQARGGSLGVQRLDEVRIGLRDEATFEQWHRFLAPVQCEDNLWQFNEGPALRFLPDGDLHPVSIVLRVESLTQAMEALRAKNLPFELVADQVEVGPAGTSGLRIILRGS